MREVVVLGVGMHNAGRFPGETTLDLGRTAVLEALDDSGMEFKDLQAAYFSNRDEPTASLGEFALGKVGLNGMPIVNVENASCSGSTLFWMAYNAVALGQYDIVLAAATEKSPRGLRIPVAAVGIDFQAMMALGQMGFAVMPGFAAILMRRRMKDYGETEEQCALVSVKNHKNGSLNPVAQYQKETPLEDVLNSRMICDPITLLQCCPTSEGAAAAILCTKEVAKQYKSDGIITVASAILRSAVEFRITGLTSAGLTKMTADEAYKVAGLGPKDIDVIELHDPFTTNELLHYEDLGICGEGEGGKLLSDGVTELTGDIPVNTSGGLIARGHPIGATGLYQIGELMLQLRGEADRRQVPDAEVGLGQLEGLGPIASVIILKR